MTPDWMIVGEHAGVQSRGVEQRGGDTRSHDVGGGHRTTQLAGVGSVDQALLRDTCQGHRSNCVGHIGSGSRGTRRSNSHSGDRRRLEAGTCRCWWRAGLTVRHCELNLKQTHNIKLTV